MSQAPASPVRASGEATVIDLRVIPRSPRSHVGGVREGRLLVRVTAPPVDDAANDAVTAIIADVLDVAKRRVSLTAGQTSRNKSVSVSGLSVAEVQQRLGHARLAD